MILDFVPIWTLILGLGGVLLCPAGRLRSRRRHSLSASRRTRSRAQLMMNSIAPVWDGNETWLVLGGLGLLAAFPLAFAIIIPGGLFSRSWSCCWRWSSAASPSSSASATPRTAAFWDHAFSYGSALATFAQGVVLGASSRALRSTGRHFAGTSFDCLTPFSLLTGVALMFGYGLLGAGWLILKTEGELQAWARRAGRICLVGVGVGDRSRSASGRRSTMPASRSAGSPGRTSLFLSPVPVVTAALAAAGMACARRPQ